MSLLNIRNLSVRFGTADAVPVVDGLDLSVEKGEVLAIVGESGSGKSVTMMALMGLIDAPGIVQADCMQFDGTDMLHLKGRQRRHIVGKDLAMVFQDPMAALDPRMTVGELIAEPHNQNAYDLFIGEVIAAWADERVFRDGRWHFETADPSLRSLHHVAGGHYYAIGEALKA